MEMEKILVFLLKLCMTVSLNLKMGYIINIFAKGKIPAKIKKILWLVANGAMLTKDNLSKRN